MAIARFGLQAASSALGGVGSRHKPDSAVSARYGGDVLTSAGALLLSDVVALGIVVAAIAICLNYSGAFPAQNAFPVRDIGATFGIGIFGLIAFVAANGHYTRRLALSRELQHVACSSLIAFALSISLATLIFGLHPYLGLAAAWLFCPVPILCGRAVVRLGLKSAGVSRGRVIVFGDGAAVDRVLPSLTVASGFDGEVAGVVMHPDGCLDDASPSRGWHSVMRQYRADLVLVCGDVGEMPGSAVLSSLKKDGVRFALASYPEFQAASALRRSGFFGQDPTVQGHRDRSARPSTRLSKVILDLLIASVCIVAMLPLLLIIAVLVRRDGGPLFFGHTRIGLDGQPFRCLKFRSMVVDSENALARLLETDPQARAEWIETQKLRNDPRVTTIGRFLRATSMDELPQLFNVIRLEMSLVGPRPIVSAEVSRYGESIMYYYQTRPGLTGLWQISGRSSTGYNQRVELDRDYVRNWTIWQDFAILVKTVPAVLKRRGAY